MTSLAQRTNKDIATGALYLLIACGCVFALINMSQTWSESRSWQPVQAQLIKAEMVSGRRKRSRMHHPRASYEYTVGGVSYTGNKISLGWFPLVTAWDDERTIKKLVKGQSLTVWTNPRKPWKSVIVRRFDSYGALCWFLAGQLTLFLAYRSWRPHQRFAPGPMIPPEPISAARYLLTVSWNVMILPLVVIGMMEGRVIPLLMLVPMASAGMLLGWLTWRTHGRRWQLGTPLLVDLNDDPSTMTARFIFSPRYGTRFSGERVSPEASLAFRQVMLRSRNNKETLVTIAEGAMGTARLEFGSRSLDFTARLPDWPVSDDERPAYWELELNIAGTCLIYRLTRALPH